MDVRLKNYKFNYYYVNQKKIEFQKFKDCYVFIKQNATTSFIWRSFILTIILLNNRSPNFSPMHSNLKRYKVQVLKKKNFVSNSNTLQHCDSCTNVFIVKLFLMKTLFISFLKKLQWHLLLCLRETVVWSAQNCFCFYFFWLFLWPEVRKLTRFLTPTATRFLSSENMWSTSPTRPRTATSSPMFNPIRSSTFILWWDIEIEK